MKNSSTTKFLDEHLDNIIKEGLITFLFSTVFGICLKILLYKNIQSFYDRTTINKKQVVFIAYLHAIGFSEKKIQFFDI